MVANCRAQGTAQGWARGRSRKSEQILLVGSLLVKIAHRLWLVSKEQPILLSKTISDGHRAQFAPSFSAEISPSHLSTPHATHITWLLHLSSQSVLPAPRIIPCLASRKTRKVERESRSVMPKARHSIQIEPQQSFDKQKDYSLCLAGSLSCASRRCNTGDSHSAQSAPGLCGAFCRNSYPPTFTSP